MLAERLALLAARHGVELPSVAGAARLGLAGTIRVTQPIPLRFTNRAREQLATVDPGLPELQVADALNATDVWTWAEAKDRERTSEVLTEVAAGQRSTELSLLFHTSRMLLRCVPSGDHALLVIGVQRPYRAGFARLLVGEFTMGLGLEFDGEALARVVAGQTLAGRLKTRSDLAHDEQTERELLVGARRYLEAVREYVRTKEITARYVVTGHDPLRIEPADRPAWPKTFTRSGTRLQLPEDSDTICTAMVADITDDGVLVLECEGQPLDSGTLKLVPDEGPLRRMCEALDALLEGADEAYPRLLAALARPGSLPDLALPAIDPGEEESRKQREAVALGVATPDIALIHGPPGTGKTTVICRIVEKLVKMRQRVLLVAPTHVALDNVLERIGEAPNVIALRLGSPADVDPTVQRYTLPNRARDLGERLLRGLEQATARAPDADPVVEAQRRFRDRVEKDRRTIGSLLLLHANLVCATPIGIAQVREFRDVDTVFDVMIVDEASKATLTDFLVPAARARKWILVGDHKQLAPYVDVGELAAVVATRARQAGIEALDEEWSRQVSVVLRKHFELRMHPNQERRRRVWEELLGIVMSAFPGTDEAVEILRDVPQDAAAWRSLLEDLRAHPDDAPPGLDGAPGEHLVRFVAELFELRGLALKGIFEHLIDLPESRQVRLDHQFRMPPALAALSCQRVYGGDYRSAKQTASLGLPIPTLEAPTIWLDTSFTLPDRRYEHPRDQDWRGGDYTNDLEITIAHEIVTKCAAWAAQSWDRSRMVNGRKQPAAFELGVVCFYLQQAIRMRQRLLPDLHDGEDRWRRQHRLRAANGAPIDVHISVVDRFQGREKDVVILCTTRSNPPGVRGHVDDLNRLNVAITRARHKRIVIGDASTLAGSNGGKRRGDDDLLRALHEDSEKKTKWGQTLKMAGDR